MTSRRQFLTTVASTSGAVVLSRAIGRASLLTEQKPVEQPRIPRWRGFNLQGRFSSPGQPFSGPAFDEFDFATMAEWGFDFARLPLSYWVWGKKDDWGYVNEEPLKQIDRAIELGRQYKIHVNLNFHRIPGYCINERELEPADLFSGTKAQRDRALAAAQFHWQTFAKRYKGIPNSRLSFDLLNEPPKMRSYEGYLQERYVEIVRALVGSIRQIDPGRLIFVDGLNIGQLPVPGIEDLHVVQSTRGYLPKAVSHYTATWVPKDEFESFNIPTWPLRDDRGTMWNRERLRAECIEPYRELVDKGVQVHVGEWGCFNQTPHAVALGWMADNLSLWKEAGWGFSMWNLRGSFGVMDSGRKDVNYEEFKGHKLDRQMVELLRAH
ncbi:MAG TPA: cellulase family glycosylhydrolase [Pyrinomonadaceae bacterium]|nr:cellulase family glycosylhydrolase [Pyrinomonadaceae bacterium]